MLLARGVTLVIQTGEACERINMHLARDLLHPSLEKEKKKKHKKKWLVQIPNAYLMDVKCPDSCKITMVFSHAQYFQLSDMQMTPPLWQKVKRDSKAS